MNVASCLFKRPVAAGLVLFLAIPLAQVSAEVPQQAVAGPAAQEAPAPSNQSQAPSPQQAPQQAPDQAQSGSGKPVGTAAAPVEKTTGVTASRPAGAVIAPAKQKRARSILIRVGIVVGAAVAIGCVVGLSKGSSSRP